MHRALLLLLTICSAQFGAKEGDVHALGDAPPLDAQELLLRSKAAKFAAAIAKVPTSKPAT